MAKGDISTVTITNFARGINNLDPNEEIPEGYLGPNTVNVLPVGDGTGLRQSNGLGLPYCALATSSTRRPREITKYGLGLLLANDDGSVDKLVQQNGVQTSIATTDGASGSRIPDVVVAQDSALTTYYAYILRPSGSAATSVKVNLDTNASVTWPGSPPQGSCCITWKTRVIIGQGSRIRFSAEGNPDSWPTNNFIDIKTLDDALDDIVGFALLGEDLIVFKKKSVWLVFDPVSFENRRLFSVGALSRRAIASSKDRVYWINDKGIYSTDGDTLIHETKKVQFGASPNYSTLFDPMWSGAGGLPWPYLSLAVTPNDEVYALSGFDLLVGYGQFRDVNGNIPWFRMNSTHYGNVKALAYSSLDFGSSASSSDDHTNTVIAAEWDENGANVNDITVLVDPWLDSFWNGGSSVAIKSVLEFPVLKAPDNESNMRLRRIILYGTGDFGASGVAGASVYVNGSTSAAFTKVGMSFPSSGVYARRIRINPETRGRTFNVRLRSDTTVADWTLYKAEFVMRRAGH